MFTSQIDESYLNKIKSLGLPEKKENNEYLLIHLYGDNVRAPKGWNVKVYKNSKNELKMVTTDEAILTKLLNGESALNKTVYPQRTEPLVTPPLPKFTKGTMLTEFGNEEKDSNSPLLQIKVDDSGWGFPLGGVMIGATDGSRVEIGLIELSFFQGDLFESKAYLEEAARITVELLGRLGATPDNSKVEICPGFVNSMSYKMLKNKGYIIDKKEITGILQDELEKRFFEYVKSLGYESYYDPKQTTNVAKSFYDVINWINKDKANRMKMAKSGWKFFKNNMGSH
jgi:hypothetical protein